MNVDKDGRTHQPARKWYTLRETEKIYAAGGHVVLTVKSATKREKVMAHPYVKAAHKSDPKWLGGLQKHKVDEAGRADTERAIKNYDLDPKVTRQATYVHPKKGK